MIKKMESHFGLAEWLKYENLLSDVCYGKKSFTQEEKELLSDYSISYERWNLHKEYMKNY